MNSLAWGDDSRTLYYTTTKATAEGDQLHRLIPMEDAGEQELYTYTETLSGSAQIERGAGGDIYLSIAGATGLAKVNETDITSETLTFTGKQLAGPLPQQSQRITSAEQKPVYVFNKEIGTKAYELSDHLGNVRATVSDKLRIVVDGSGNTSYEADLLSHSNYYPFGMALPNGTYNSQNYRYGFNGMEDDWIQ